VVIDSAGFISVEELESFFDFLTLLVGQLLTMTALRGHSGGTETRLSSKEVRLFEHIQI